MIRLCFKKEIEQRYSHKVQKLYKTPWFELIKNNQLRDLDWATLDNIISELKKLILIIASFILSASPILKILLTSHLASIKLLAIFVIIYKSANQNNRNYILLLVVIDMYSASIKIDAIILNCFALLVSYNMLLKMLRDITISSIAFIKEQSSNLNLIDIWNKFEYWENLARERIGDIVKFRSIIMVFLIKNR